MSDKSGSKWTDATWDPVTGYLKVLAGAQGRTRRRPTRARIVWRRPDPDGARGTRGGASGPSGLVPVGGCGAGYLSGPTSLLHPTQRGVIVAILQEAQQTAAILGRLGKGEPSLTTRRYPADGTIRYSSPLCDWSFASAMEPRTR